MCVRRYMCMHIFHCFSNQSFPYLLKKKKSAGRCTPLDGASMSLPGSGTTSPHPQTASSAITVNASWQLPRLPPISRSAGGAPPVSAIRRYHHSIKSASSLPGSIRQRTGKTRKRVKKAKKHRTADNQGFAASDPELQQTTDIVEEEEKNDSSDSPSDDGEGVTEQKRWHLSVSLYSYRFNHKLGRVSKMNLNSLSDYRLTQLIWGIQVNSLSL